MCQSAPRHPVLVCALFSVQGGMWTAVHIPPCTGKQSAFKYMIGCHITHNNGILIILIREFSWELYVLPDDDMRCAIEICRSSEKCFSVKNFRLIYDMKLVHLLVCNTQRIKNVGPSKNFSLGRSVVRILVINIKAVPFPCSYFVVTTVLSLIGLFLLSSKY